MYALMVNALPLKTILKKAVDDQHRKGYPCCVCCEVPADRSDIQDDKAMMTTKQFLSTKVQAVDDGGHTLDVWIDINDDGDTCWFGYSDYCNLEGMLGGYAYDLLPIEDEA